jgi:hypothetical protein
MENTAKFETNSRNTPWSVVIIEKVHRCADCPIRKMAVKLPQSIFARIHMWHKTWWPAWKAHQDRTCAYAARAGAHA